MPLINVKFTDEELCELIDFAEGSDISPQILFKLAAARDVLEQIYRGDEDMLVRQICENLGEDAITELAEYALKLYKGEKMPDKLTDDELNELRMYAAEFNSPMSRDMVRRITEVIGDINDY